MTLERGMLKTETVSTRRKTTAGDGMGGSLAAWSAHLTRLWCRIYKPPTETTHEDEGMRDESTFVMLCDWKADIQLDDQIVRADGTVLTVTGAKRPKNMFGNAHRKFLLRESMIPATRPAGD